ncbi:MAG: UDP-3-O-acyl-N-acetylglucosamine deacetylase, partial [Bacteroidia bacterium]|nr:UDP-3-O-acyl-N-acetylglucosamine deacetylase [Bacteroidia bacterium]
MYVKQHTLKEEVRLEGTGLHSGAAVTLTIKPAPEKHGFKFVRTDLPGRPEIAAALENVVEFQRSTTLAHGDVRVQTTEHVLAALYGLQIDNALLELHGPEPPALDGSAAVYVEKIKEVGIVKQKENREFLVIEEPVHYHDAEQNHDLAALQFDDFRVTVMVDYNSPKLGVQHATLIRMEDFEREIAPGRTFCFWRELRPLVQAGFISGGNLNNSVVIVDEPVDQKEIEEVARLF